jgi:hypothetical protein
VTRDVLPAQEVPRAIAQTGRRPTACIDFLFNG